MSRDRRLQDITADSYLLEALTIVKQWKDDMEEKGKKNPKLTALVNAQVNINIYIASLRMEREGYDMAIDGANKWAKSFEEKADALQKEVDELKEKLKLYEL